MHWKHLGEANKFKLLKKKKNPDVVNTPANILVETFESNRVPPPTSGSPFKAKLYWFLHKYSL